MPNLHRLLDFFRPRERISAPYVLHDHWLYTKVPINIKHDRIRFVRKAFRKGPELQVVDLQGESFYLLLQPSPWRVLP